MLRNSSRVAVFFAAVLFVSLAAPGVVAAKENVTLTVTVVDRNDDPVSDVDLSAVWDEDGPVNETTRSNGQALIDVPKDADVTIGVPDDQYARNANFTVDDASTREVEVPVARSGTATIEVVDADGPVANAIVQIRRDGEFVLNSRADDRGVATTDAIEQGDYRAIVRTGGYLRNETNVTVDGDVTREIRIQRAARRLRVTVLDDHFSPAKPVNNVTVDVENRGTVSTLSNGQATFQVPVNAEYAINASKSGYESNGTTVEVRESEVTANLTVQRQDAISLEPSVNRVVAGETVRVTVTDEYGDPVGGATVSVAGESAGETNDEGVATVPVDAAGTNNLTAAIDGLEANATVKGISAGNGSDGETTATTDGSGPGFTVAAVLVALVGFGLLARRR